MLHSWPHFTSHRAEQRYCRAMEALMAERGRVMLAQAFRLSAADCPAGCECPGCARVREEIAQVTAFRKGKGKVSA